MKKKVRSHLRIGQRIRHESGCTVKIVDGQFMVHAHGQSRVSNFWYWRRVRKDGTLGQRGYGYGLVNQKGILTGGEWERPKRTKKKTEPTEQELAIMHGDGSCTCGHGRKRHWNRMGFCSECGCTWWHPKEFG
jgi:hypothetical protein